VIIAHETDALSDILSSHGFAAVPGTRLCVAHRGRFLEDDLSLHFYHIKSGDSLICLVKQQPSTEKSRKFLESLSPVRRVVCQMVPLADSIEENRRAEEARLSDLSLASWEATTDFREVMKDLLEQQEPQKVHKEPEDQIRALDLTPATQISDAPLPTFFRASTIPHNGVIKSGYEWGSGYRKDRSDQPKRGNFFDNLKK
jgi:hypothetical protein